MMMAGVPKFRSIEGLRGWLAWTVVLAHLAFVSNLYARGLGGVLRQLAAPAVFVFIIISGFVITHLLHERSEPYSTYLLRRFMRIFPLFAVTCVIGYFTNDLYADTLSHVSYAGDPSFGTAAAFADIAHSN